MSFRPDQPARPSGRTGVWLPWRTAMSDALYGDDGFFRRHQPADHFRTSPHVSEAFAAALVQLIDSAGLDCVLDVGAGGGELLRTLARLRPELRLIGVEIADRPSDLPSGIAWWHRLPDEPIGSALLVANEWLDNVPMDVAALAPDGRARLLEVRRALPATAPDTRSAEHPQERLGPALSEAETSWLRHWWPLTTSSTDADTGAGAGAGAEERASVQFRAELGLQRDRAWSAAIGSIAGGLALAVDYGHLAEARPVAGTLCGWRDGRPTAPIPDGNRDITAHVAIDAVREAGERAGATTLQLTTQSDALRGLGLSGTRPSLSMTQRDPAGYLSELARASATSELLDPTGLGGYYWLLQSIDRS